MPTMDDQKLAGTLVSSSEVPQYPTGHRRRGGLPRASTEGDAERLVKTYADMIRLMMKPDSKL